MNWGAFKAEVERRLKEQGIIDPDLLEVDLIAVTRPSSGEFNVNLGVFSKKILEVVD
jgi:hypothetical protein